MTAGYICCFSCDEHPGLYKIVITTRTPTLILLEANKHNVWILNPVHYSIMFAKQVSYPKLKIQKIYKLLNAICDDGQDHNGFYKVNIKVIQNIFDMIHGTNWTTQDDNKPIANDNVENDHVVITI